MLLYTFLLLAILRLPVEAEDKAEVNIKVSGACSPSKFQRLTSILIPIFSIFEEARHWAQQVSAFDPIQPRENSVDTEKSSEFFYV
jgi:hypothetical protein